MTKGFVFNLGIRRPMVVLVQLQQRNAKKEASSSSVRKSIRPKYIIDAVATKDPKFLRTSSVTPMIHRTKLVSGQARMELDSRTDQSATTWVELWRLRQKDCKNEVGRMCEDIQVQCMLDVATMHYRILRLHISSLGIGFDQGLSNTLQILKTCMVV